MRSADVPVLILGGGPVGLTASLLLSDLGVDSLLVERNATTTDHPKAHIVNTRSMEILRAFGIESALREQAISDAALGHVRWVRSLAGAELGRLDTAPGVADLSPTRVVSCAQDRVEALLLEATATRRGRLRFGAEVVALAPDADGVTAMLASGEPIRARYAIAADGASSFARRQLGITMIGAPEIATMVGTYFHADLRSLFEARPAVLYWVMNSAAPGTFVALDGANRWVFHLAQSGNGEEVSEERALALIRIAIGEPDAKVEVQSIRPWRMTAQVAETYRCGRVLLAGDAAHRFPPTGGLGMNTGIQDVHNLAWKLALVLDGAAPDALLDTYEQERKPIAEANSTFSLKNVLHGGIAVGPGARAATAKLEADGPEVPAVLAQLHADIEAGRAHFGSQQMDLGFRYASGALVPEAMATAPDTEERRDTRWRPSARTGARAPHAWLVHEGARVSTLDLFGKRFVLLVAGSAEVWSCAARDARERVSVVEIGSGAPFELGPGGALLIRPDGHIAWRSDSLPGDPGARLGQALREVLGHAP